MADDDTRTLDPALLADAEAMLVVSARRMREIEREARRVTRQDWETLFRQMAAIVSELASHPFLVGDTEAETRMAWLLRADDMEELDQRTDRLAEYLYAKLEYNLALRAVAAANPDAPEDAVRQAASAAARVSATQHGSPSGSRRLIRSGPSGDDYQTGAADDGTDPKPTRQRSRIRL